jgi:hypothetical protein
MAYLGSWKIDDWLTFYCNTHRADTGAATDADAVPSYRVYEDETAAAIATGNLALLDNANTAGFYSERVQLLAATGFEKGRQYSIYISATVNAVTGTIHHTFQIEAEVDANTVSGAAPSVTGAVGSVTGNVGGNVAGSVASVTGAVGSVTGAVGSVAAGGITAASIATGAVDADALATDAAVEIADETLKRDASNVQDTADTTSLTTMILAAMESSISGVTWTIRKTDGTTFVTKTVTTDATADPITGVT